MSVATGEPGNFFSMLFFTSHLLCFRDHLCQDESGARLMLCLPAHLKVLCPKSECDCSRNKELCGNINTKLAPSQGYLSMQC